MTNVVVITGRLCADPESRQTQSGTAVCHFRLAVGRNRKVEGKPEADFISCVCWGKTAEFAVKYLHRGGMITAEGRLQNADYTDNNGVKHYAMEVNVDQLNFCGDGKPSGNAQQAAQGDAGNYPQNYPPQQPNGCRSRGRTGTDSERRRRMKKKKEVKVPKSRQLLSMAIELAAQSERLVLLNEVGCVDDVIQVAEQLCGKLGNLIAFAKDIQRGAKQHDLEGMHEEKETVHGA